MKSKRRITGVAFVGTLATALVMTGCSAPTPASSNGNNRYSIAVITNSKIQGYYVALADGAKKEAEKLGADFSWQAPNDVNAAGQTALLQSVAAKRPSAIIMSVIDKDALVQPMKQIMASGIPIITVDADTRDPSARLARVASDDQQCGQLMAKSAATLAGDSGEVGYIGYLPGVEGVDARLAAYEKALKTMSGIKYVGAQYANLDISEYVQKTASVLAAHPNVKVINTSWEVAAAGVAQGVQQSGKGDSVKVIGFDATPDEVSLLKKGQLASIVAQQPVNMGKTAVDDAYKYLKDKVKPKDANLPCVEITPDNVDSAKTAPYLLKDVGK
ncbi:substrate-binding domain-containing protein [Leifsonia sp. RAF41]|uniref:substrate-binding domain-containing protein n=1 Tax=Leifsonia sp. RAF41 TaxID=3233056 RepID=UPI003F99A0C4